MKAVALLLVPVFPSRVLSTSWHDRTSAPSGHRVLEFEVLDPGEPDGSFASTTFGGSSSLSPAVRSSRRSRGGRAPWSIILMSLGEGSCFLRLLVVLDGVRMGSLRRGGYVPRPRARQGPSRPAPADASSHRCVASNASRAAPRSTATVVDLPIGTCFSAFSRQELQDAVAPDSAGRDPCLRRMPDQVVGDGVVDGALDTLRGVQPDARLRGWHHPVLVRVE